MRRFVPSHPDTTTMRKLGAGAFLFFLIKGLLWLVAPVVMFITAS